jgi:hypothetical protein
MRIHSNIILPWPHVLHVFNSSRIYSGQWGNFNFFRITSINPLDIHSHSPINLLETNRKYYLYNNYFRDTTQEKYGNINTNITIYDPTTKSVELTNIWIPKISEAGDVILVHTEDTRNTSPYSFATLY